MTFLGCVLIEIRKTKRTFALWLTLLSATFIPTIYFLFYLFKSTQPISEGGANPWDKFFGLHLMAAGPLLIPLFVVLLTSLVLQIEHRANGIKKLYTLPVPRWYHYCSKLLVVCMMIFLAYFIFGITILGSGAILGQLKPILALDLYEPEYLLFARTLFKSYIAVLAIVGLQFWLSFRVRNFVIPIGIGLVMVVAALLVHKAEEALYFPYAYNLLNLFQADAIQATWMTKASLLSLLVFVITTVGGSLETSRMDIK